MQMKSNTAKTDVKTDSYAQPEDDPPKVKACCNFNLHNYSCVDGYFYVIYNKLTLLAPELLFFNFSTPCI